MTSFLSTRPKCAAMNLIGMPNNRIAVEWMRGVSTKASAMIAMGTGILSFVLSPSPTRCFEEVYA